jgi:hypothetical protein
VWMVCVCVRAGGVGSGGGGGGDAFIEKLQHPPKIMQGHSKAFAAWRVVSLMA